MIVTEVFSNLGNTTVYKRNKFPMWIPSHRKRDTSHYKDRFYNRTSQQRVGFSRDSDYPSLDLTKQYTKNPMS